MNPCIDIRDFFCDGGMEFQNYWIETGGSKLLMDIAKKVDFSLLDDLSEPMDINSFKNFDILRIQSKGISKLDFISLLLQTGYLSIKGKGVVLSSIYVDYPNLEVAQSFTANLLETYGVKRDAMAGIRGEIALLRFNKGNTEAAIEEMRKFFHAFPMIFHL